LKHGDIWRGFSLGFSTTRGTNQVPCPFEAFASVAEISSIA
jgi:hypothetical protein